MYAIALRVALTLVVIIGCFGHQVALCVKKRHKNASAASDKLRALSKQAIDPAFVSFCSFGKATSVPSDKVTFVVTCEELVTNPSLS